MEAGPDGCCVGRPRGADEQRHYLLQGEATLCQLVQRFSWSLGLHHLWVRPSEQPA